MSILGICYGMQTMATQLGGQARIRLCQSSSTQSLTIIK
ncbi:GMP synthase [glutamine-hydrolyzing], amidotransferase subunit (EC 6.3.5.2) / GMP synthase [glutamine-hydrolyzing], ATP pyrophosphatase subunit (EC 6.3.5.2) [uncultured Gammaproteobacteria bacterium]|nr:GMP synthase [glutamine-hydrolyzing], amidotransferase subunit (EC 6.3.5.2) / GMP synthase [glutamine-hydrolyzing], ATP pyrophosphatase subunit (EC 6.3.5.2) [uncultured Gammaproteobacteria bacterium]